jgi:hypothetical protein
MSLSDLNAVLADIGAKRRLVNQFLEAGLQNGLGFDAFTLAGEISALVATGGANPAAIMAAIQTLTKINSDFNAAEAAAKAQAASPTSVGQAATIVTGSNAGQPPG